MVEDWAFGGRFPKCSSNEFTLDSVPLVQMLEQERPEAQGFRYLPASGKVLGLLLDLGRFCAVQMRFILGSSHIRACV